MRLSRESEALQTFLDDEKIKLAAKKEKSAGDQVVP